LKAIPGRDLTQPKVQKAVMPVLRKPCLPPSNYFTRKAKKKNHFHLEDHYWFCQMTMLLNQ
jgi:hypothetical protein